MQPLPQPSPPAPLPASVPNHDGSPQDGTRAQIGVPLPAIGQIVSASSSLTMDKAVIPPKPRTKAKPGCVLPIVLLILGLLLGVGLGFVANEVFKHSLKDLLDLNRKARELVVLIGVALPTGGLGGILGFAISWVMASKKNKAAPGTIGECTYLGTEGVAQARRTTEGEEMQVVRFDQATYLKVERTLQETTFTRGNTSWKARWDKVTLQMGVASGKPFYVWASHSLPDQGKPDADHDGRRQVAFANATEDAYTRFAVPRMMATLQQQGAIRFAASGNDGIEVRQGRIDVTRGGRQAAFAPSDVTRFEVANGNMYIDTAATGRITFSLGELQNAKCLQACLAAVGVR